MCRAFEVIASQSTDERIYSRYGKACILKFLNIWIRAQEGELNVSSFRFIELTFRGCWEKYMKRCKVTTDSARRNGYSHYSTSDDSRISIVDFVEEANCFLFSSQDLLFFQKLMEGYSRSNKDMLIALEKIVWLMDDRPRLPFIASFD